MRSSSSEAVTRSPSSRRRDCRLLMIVPLESVRLMAEEVITVESVRSDDEVAHARVVGEDDVDGRWDTGRASPLIEDVSDRLSSERVPTVGFDDGLVERWRAV